MLFEQYLKVVDENADLIRGVANALWDDPELAFGEYKAVDLFTEILEKNGFTVQRNLTDIPTAFKATYGTGAPHLGVLAEYDGLEGFSQAAFTPVETWIPGKDRHHGCGHNLFGAGSLGAVLAIKEYIKETGKGSITLFGCPAEEGGSGKVYMARDGAFQGIDAIVSWHPEKMYMVRTRPSLANVKVNYSFTGIPSHAGGSPEKGRSALDAAELMNVGVNFLREHMDLTSRVHYAFLDAGGTAPNTVQSHAKVTYMIRAVDADGVRELHERVTRIAQGAALMTDTTMTTELVSAYSNLITIPTLQATANEAMHDIPIPVPTEEEIDFARKLQQTMILTKAQKEQAPFAEKVLDPAPPVAHGGSTDTADVSWNCPTVQMHIGTWCVGTPTHSWQSSSQAKGPYAHRAMLYASKAVAQTIMRLFDDPKLLEQAKQEHAEKVGEEGYICPIPKELKPIILPRP